MTGSTGWTWKYATSRSPSVTMTTSPSHSRYGGTLSTASHPASAWDRQAVTGIRAGSTPLDSLLALGVGSGAIWAHHACSDKSGRAGACTYPVAPR